MIMSPERSQKHFVDAGHLVLGQPSQKWVELLTSQQLDYELVMPGETAGGTAGPTDPQRGTEDFQVGGRPQVGMNLLARTLRVAICCVIKHFLHRFGDWNTAWRLKLKGYEPSLLVVISLLYLLSLLIHRKEQMGYSIHIIAC